MGLEDFSLPNITITVLAGRRRFVDGMVCEPVRALVVELV
jgi:hypothetical protein